MPVAVRCAHVRAMHIACASAGQVVQLNDRSGAHPEEQEGRAAPEVLCVGRRPVARDALT